MAPHDSDPALATPIPIDGDGAEMIGTVIDGRYRLDATLGRGGMGLVYRATHVNLRRQVAVKILHPSLAASPDVRNRFEREALAVGHIDHPNCVSTYDVGRLPGGALYLAMELLEGKSLADVLEAEGQLAPGRALHILAHVLRGLGHIHAAGLIHRDIKPENIFLIRQGNDVDFAKILDFGIAKPMAGELDDGVRLTQAGMAFGTPIYMAPEQALGNPMDGRADLYAAATIGYEMLCGQPPFYSEDKLEVMSMHAGKPVPPMRSRLVRGGKPVPSSVEKLIVRGLTKKPNDRYPNADVFLAAVEAVLHTRDGGQTDVNFERPDSEETGARSLLDDDGQLDITGNIGREEASSAIADDIEEALLATPTKPQPPVAGALPRQPTPAPPGTVMNGPARVATKMGVEPPVVAAGDPRGRPGGGVGIGIPYTGPSGEPIFGLTPEQRLARVPKRKRWKLVAAIAAVAVVATVAGIGIALWTAPSDDNQLDPATPAGQARDALAHGDPARAIQLLTANPAAVANDPDAQLALGDAYSAQHDSHHALDAYRKALVLDAATATSAELRDNLRVMAADTDAAVVRDAFDLWIGTGDDKALAALGKAVVAPQSATRREAARQVIEQRKLQFASELMTSYELDLDDRDLSCVQRRAAVARLRALRNPEAIEALKRALVPSRKRINYCLLADVQAAIGFLDGLKK
ncbi:MAG TPA: protein kinase [Kofleriaceae bacterium]|nr:protein kinase [Kofleriaceae bacterium]